MARAATQRSKAQLLVVYSSVVAWQYSFAIANRANRQSRQSRNRPSRQSPIAKAFLFNNNVCGHYLRCWTVFLLLFICVGDEMLQGTSCREIRLLPRNIRRNCLLRLLALSGQLAQKQLPQNKAKEGHSCNAFAACCWLSKH